MEPWLITFSQKPAIRSYPFQVPTSSAFQVRFQLERTRNDYTNVLDLHKQYTVKSYKDSQTNFPHFPITSGSWCIQIT